MQATLAVLDFLLGILAWYTTSKLVFVIEAVLLAANWPWTLFVMMPVNTKLMNAPLENAGQETRSLLMKWNQLHAVRAILEVYRPWHMCLVWHGDESDGESRAEKKAPLHRSALFR